MLKVFLGPKIKCKKIFSIHGFFERFEYRYEIFFSKIEEGSLKNFIYNSKVIRIPLV